MASLIVGKRSIWNDERSPAPIVTVSQAGMGLTGRVEPLVAEGLPALEIRGVQPG